MKFHKLVKSIDYVTYPVLIELRKTNNILGNSLSSFRNLIISAVMGVLFDITPMSEFIIEDILKKSSFKRIAMFGNCRDADKIIAICLAGLLYGVLYFRHIIMERWGSNKDTVDERKEITFEFYKVVIPGLISAKSLVEQHDDSKGNEDKQFLLLLQAKHELEELLCLLSRLDVIEIDEKTNLLTHDSKDVLDQIGKEAYCTVLIEILECIQDVYTKIQNCSSKPVNNTLSELKSRFFSAKVFTVCNKLNPHDPLLKSLKKRYKDIENSMNPAKTT